MCRVYPLSITILESCITSLTPTHVHQILYAYRKLGKFLTAPILYSLAIHLFMLYLVKTDKGGCGIICQKWPTVPNLEGKVAILGVRH